MLYLVGKILIFLLMAATLGFVFGWYLRNIFRQKNTTDTQVNDSKNFNDINTFRVENEKLKQQLDNCLEISKDFQKAKSSSAKKKKDNLQEISGIGSVLALKLNDLGIHSFDQIANWGKTDVENISQKIGPFRDRIKRDNWIIQAKELLINK